MRIWLLTHCKFNLSKYCLIIFNAFVMQQTPSRAKCQHNYCFRVFWYVCLYAYPKRFFGGRKVVLVVEIICLFFDIQVIFCGQLISIISSIFF